MKKKKTVNIAGVGSTDFQESIGNAILIKKLEQNKTIKTLFSTDKRSNVDGSFLLLENGNPINEFFVQNKTQERLKKSKRTHEFYYDCDPKIINWINILYENATVCPAIVFVVETSSEKIYWKYLDKDLLLEYYLTEKSANTSSRIKFKKQEELTDVDTFYQQLLQIMNDRKEQRYNLSFGTSKYQEAFDVINNFFDINFPKIKETAYENIWKFGIAYKEASFGVYSILRNSPLPAYQEVDGWKALDKDSTIFPFVGPVSTGFNEEYTIVPRAYEWLEFVFKDAVKYKWAFVKAFPDDALYEIAYNFLDSLAYYQTEFCKQNYRGVFNKDSICLSEFTGLLGKKYPPNIDFINSEVILIRKTAEELARRNVDEIKRIWLHQDEIRYMPNATHFRSYSHNDYLTNTIKLFCQMPTYYNDFIDRLTPHADKYIETGMKIYTFKFTNTLHYKYYATNDKFDIHVLEQNEFNALDKKTFDEHGFGQVRTNFSSTPLVNNLLSLLYKNACRVHGFEKESSVVHDLMVDFK